MASQCAAWYNWIYYVKEKKKYHGLKLCESDINNSDVNVCRYLIIAEAEQELRKRPRQFVLFHSVLSQSWYLI